ncbi:transcription factor IIF subunit tfg1 [Coemansia sp. RSA 1200]|nr:transcription factor IIF subunit tfg1 [Coemansia sp. RSA 1200]
MSSGIRRNEKRPTLGSAGIRNSGIRSQVGGNSGTGGRRLAPGVRQGRKPPPLTQQRGGGEAPLVDADIPLAAATAGVTTTGTSTEAAAAKTMQDTRPCIEYPLMSATPQTTHNVMRFLETNTVNLRELTQPVKLRRRNREYYRLKNKRRNEERAALLAAKAEAELHVDDGKKPEGAQSGQTAAAADSAAAAGESNAQQQQQTQTQQQILLQQQAQRPKADMSLIADLGGARRNKKNLFKKRTKQVYFADEEKRRLDIEEARPWVLEDDDETEMWTGSLEGAQNSAHVLFVLTDDGFRVVPVDRWYKFAPRLKYKTLTLDEAEEVLKTEQKIDNRSRWIMRKHMQQKDVGESEDAPKEKEPATRAPSKPALVEYEAMDDDDDAFGADDAQPASRKARPSGKNGDYDEVNFEMEFDDDEELGDVQFEYNEEESREKEERKRKSHIGGGDDDEEDEEDGVGDGANARNALDDDGKTIKKLIRKREDSKDYESDDDNENPYLSLSEISDSSSDDEDNTPKDAADQQGQQQPDATSKEAESTDAAASASARSPSPSPPLAATAAAAATSPPASMKKRKRISVGGSHQQQHAGGAGGSTSPLAPPGPKHSKLSGHSAKAQQTTGSSSVSASSSSADLITRREIIDLIKSGVNTTKDLIGCVRKKLKANPENKSRIQMIVKDVAILKNDRLALKKP